LHHGAQVVLVSVWTFYSFGSEAFW
jgi:hypothetical protein